MDEAKTTSAKEKIFNSLLQQSPTRKHLIYLANLLAIWHQNVEADEPSTDLHDCWFKLLQEVMRRNEASLVVEFRQMAPRNCLLQEVLHNVETTFMLIGRTNHSSTFRSRTLTE